MLVNWYFHLAKLSNRFYNSFKIELELIDKPSILNGDI